MARIEPIPNRTPLLWADPHPQVPLSKVAPGPQDFEPAEEGIAEYLFKATQVRKIGPRNHFRSGLAGKDQHLWEPLVTYGSLDLKDKQTAPDCAAPAML